MGLIAELFNMLSFWSRHRRCDGFKEVKAFGGYMLWCPVHEVGQTTGDADMDKVTIHVTFLDAGGKVIEYHKVDPSESVNVPSLAFSIMVNATSDER